MSRKIQSFIKKRIWYLVVLIVIIVIGCGYISQKEGYHMDELLSFELSNAEFTPWIVPTQPEGRLEKFVKNEIDGETLSETLKNVVTTVKDVLRNRSSSKLLSYQADTYDEPVWISADQFHQYITTDAKDRFNYLSVYFNVKDDNHPPLHFMLLHTISSIFLGQIHPWMGCIINLVAIIGICILLMRICSEIYERPYMGIAVSILYACSMAGLQTLLLIRMYALLTFWCVAALYMHLKKMKSGDWKKGNKLLITILVLGFVTQYFFVFFVIFVAIVTFVLLILRKNMKQVVYYVRTLVIAAVIGLCVFPFAIQDVLSSGRGVEAVENLSSGLVGMQERVTQFLLIFWRESTGGWISMAIVILCLLIALVMMLVRHTQVWSNIKNYWKTREKRERICLLLIPVVGYFFIVSRAAPYYEDRYMMPIFPFVALIIVMIVQIFLEQITHNKKAQVFVILCITVAMVLPGMLMNTPEYLYKGYHEQEVLSNQYSADDCICVYDGVGYYQNLIEFTNYQNTLLVTQDELLSRDKDQRLEQDEEIVVLLKNNISEEKVSDFLENEYGYHMTKVLLQKGVHQDTIYLFQK